MQRVNINGTETKALKQDEYVSAVVKDGLCCTFVPPLTARSPVHCPAPLFVVSLICERRVHFTAYPECSAKL